MANYAKIGNMLYPLLALARENGSDSRWGGRQSVSLRLQMTYEEAKTLFADDMDWSVIEQADSYILADKDGKPVTRTPEPVETDKSEFCLAGPITDHRDGTVTVKMGRLLDSEALDIIFGEE